MTWWLHILRNIDGISTVSPFEVKGTLCDSLQFISIMSAYRVYEKFNRVLTLRLDIGYGKCSSNGWTKKYLFSSMFTKSDNTASVISSNFFQSRTLLTSAEEIKSRIHQYPSIVIFHSCCFVNITIVISRIEIRNYVWNWLMASVSHWPIRHQDLWNTSTLQSCFGLIAGTIQSSSTMIVL